MSKTRRDIKRQRPNPHSGRWGDQEEARLGYPPPTVPLAALIAPVVQGDPRRYSGDWHAAIAEEQRALRERQERERVRFCTK